MALAWLCAAALISGGPAPEPSPPPDLAASYREARDKAGRSPEAQVALALWCEARGLDAERLRHLALAVLADPSNAAARGLMGLVPHGGRWLKPEAIAAEAKADPTLAEYESRRLQAPYTADGQWALGLWADEHGLRQQARAHLTAVIRLDPARDAAWKKLGYRRFEGRWRTDAQVAAAKAEADAQERADRAWGPALARWRDELAVPAKRAEAEAGLAGLTDPRAVASVVKVFGSGGPGPQEVAVRLLGQVDSPGSSRALALLATWGKTPAIRRVAAEILGHRDPREFLGLLIGQLRKPIRYEMGLNPNLDGGGPRPYFAVEGEKAWTKFNSNWTVDQGVPSRLFVDAMPFDPYAVQARMYAGLVASPEVGSTRPLPGPGGHHPAKSPPGGNAPAAIDPGNAMVYQATYAASLRDAQIARALSNGPTLGPRFRAEVTELKAQIDAYNAAVERDGPALYASLTMITGQNLPQEPEPWKRWWVDSLGYSYKSPTSQADQAATKPTVEYLIISCFAAGTPVRTLTGDRPIEALRVGDQVLAQDTGTGGLRYRSVAAVHHNPPAEVLRVGLGDEVILATGFHRFWKAGRGWIMARELKPGDVLRTLGGLASVASIEPDRVQPVYNLDVADDADFFVGRVGALVHDNTLPDPRLAPFDAGPGPSKRAGPPALSAAKAGTR